MHLKNRFQSYLLLLYICPFNAKTGETIVGERTLLLDFLLLIGNFTIYKVDNIWVCYNNRTTSITAL